MNTLATTSTNTTDRHGNNDAGWMETALRALAPWRRRTAQQTLPESAALLLARADAYQATQPSFAADLRAGAQCLIDAR